MLLVDYTKKVTEMTTNKLVVVPQDHDSSDGMAPNQFLHT